MDVAPISQHLNACFPEPALERLPYMGPAIEGALIYDDWIASVVATRQACEPLRVPLFGELRMPLADPVMTSAFGPRYHPVRKRWLPHTGVDLVDRERRWRVPVFASGMGTVMATGSFAEYGRSVIIDHGWRVATVYTHLSIISVREGDRVEAGDRIGRLGSTGAVTGPHLHFELRLGGAAVDPLDYVAPWPQPPPGHT
ncbi:M23 family metallopeptidase [Candidatus Poriferisodalis sp.]|uniref:M23 family metallopeptidase n=1 Tax=Candidatus Poriferisodalis sp. TaxID=3101277 RepID=UPI003B01BE18